MAPDFLLQLHLLQSDLLQLRWLRLLRRLQPRPSRWHSEAATVAAADDAVQYGPTSPAFGPGSHVTASCPLQSSSSMRGSTLSNDDRFQKWTAAAQFSRASRLQSLEALGKAARGAMSCDSIGLFQSLLSDDRLASQFESFAGIYIDDIVTGFSKVDIARPSTVADVDTRELTDHLSADRHLTVQFGYAAPVHAVVATLGPVGFRADGSDTRR